MSESQPQTFEGPKEIDMFEEEKMQVRAWQELSGERVSIEDQAGLQGLS